MRQALVGSIVGVVTAVGLGAAMLPLRSRLSFATTALVLVVPVVAGVIVGGLRAGVLSVVADSWSTTSPSCCLNTRSPWGPLRTGSRSACTQP
ncbi:MAG TPA: hypothetical protein VLX59_11640 [Acidimicrobiales bacterium]|nr:hypothetical protein [Acidimicrobiales bacterium]